MSKYHITICPACGKGKIKSVRWKDGSSCEPDKYLDEDLNLTCAGCSRKEFIFDLYFKCDYHDAFRKPNPMDFMVSLQRIFRSSYIPGDILKKMMIKISNIAIQINIYII